MIEVRFRPLADPDPRKTRKKPPFKVSYGRTLTLLDYELRQVGASGVIIEAGFRLEQLRQDGWPYANAKPSHPAVKISFRNKRGQSLGFPCDTYNSIEGNIRAISLTLEALRAVDRYGVTQTGEQYRGWTALPAAPSAEQSLSRESAIAVIATLAGLSYSDAVFDMKAAYRAAARNAHPDSGGTQEAFVQLQRAWAVVGG